MVKEWRQWGGDAYLGLLVNLARVAPSETPAPTMESHGCFSLILTFMDDLLQLGKALLRLLLRFHLEMAKAHFYSCRDSLLVSERGSK